jgi:hypothetical protein
MGRAVILTTASKAGTTGGTFADSLTANTGDSLAVANFQDGNAKILNWWGMDAVSVAEFELIYTRPQSTHDQSHGLRTQVQALFPGGAGKPAAQDFLPGGVTVRVFPSDTAAITATSTASDNLITSYQILYDDLPGAAGVFISPQQAASLQNSTVGINVNAVASATAGAYGATRAFNTDDARCHANTWYAILGYNTQTPVTTISLLGPDWGGQRIGGPGSPVAFHTSSWFMDESLKWGLPLIPCFNSNNVGNINVQIADNIANTSPKIDFILYELTGPPVAGS